MREIDPGFAHINLGHSDINTAIAKYGPKMLKKFQIFEEEYELKYFTGLKPYPELIAFLKAEGKKYTNFLYTSNVKKIIYPALLELGLENSFSKVVTFDDIDFMKPHPDGLKFILDSAIPKSKYLFVGDSPSDEGAAKAAGLDFFKIHFFHEWTTFRRQNSGYRAILNSKL